MQRVLKRAILAALLFGGLSAPAQAALITTNPTIIVGDKQFSDFTCSILVVGVAVPTSCAGVDVTGATDLSGNFGLLFQIGAFVNTIGSTVDILIGYTATVLDPNYLITDVHLGFNGAITGTGFANVTETVFAGGGVTQLLVQNPPPILDATILLPGGFSSVRVTKDILLGVTGPGAGSAALSFVGQYLSQTRVPEPGSLALLGMAFFGSSMALRRRFRASA